MSAGRGPMRMRLAAALLALACAAAGPAAGPAAAQHAWDVPGFLAPNPGSDLGVYLVSPAGGDVGVQAIWRQTGNLNLGVRGGLARTGTATMALLGAEFFGLLLPAGAALPVDVAWTLGVGGAMGDGTSLRVPAGLSIGWPLARAGLALVPYVHPRGALDVYARADRTTTRFVLDLDLGADLRLGPGVVLRLGWTMGESEAFGAGIAWRMERGVVVR
jgi:hypothetical protein